MVAVTAAAVETVIATPHETETETVIGAGMWRAIEETDIRSAGIETATAAVAGIEAGTARGICGAGIDAEIPNEMSSRAAGNVDETAPNQQLERP